MTVKYKTVITKAGAEKLAAATVPNGKKVNFVAMAVGDGGGKLPEPNASQTKLVNEVWRHALNKISQDKKHKNYVVAELVIPPETGGFWLREMGLYDDTGVLIAVGNMAESYKPELAEGSGRAQTLRMVIMVSDIDTVELSIDTTLVMATQDYVDDKLAEHEQSRRHPDATLKEKGFTQLSSATDSTSEALAATPKAVKAAYDLANGKYTAQDATTKQKGIVQLTSATDNVSETLAATPKAVKVVYDLASAKYTAQDATTGQKGIVQLSSSLASTSETQAATPKAIKAVNDELVKVRDSLGTASKADIVTSLDDTTAGRTPVVGWQGLGAATHSRMGSASQFFAYTGAADEVPLHGAGWQSSYAPSRRAQAFVAADSRFYSRFSISATLLDAETPWACHYTTLNKPAAADVDAVSASQGGTFQKGIAVKGNGATVALWPLAAGQSTYLLGKDYNGDNLFYVGRGSANYHVSLFNYKGGSGIVLGEDGSISVTTSNARAVNVSGDLRAAGEVQSTSGNSFRIAYGNYGVFWRNDGTNHYLMLTNSGDAWGNYSSLRPLTVNLPTGRVTVGHGLSVVGQAVPSDYGNFDARYTLKSATVIDVRQGSAGTIILTRNGWNYVPAGCAFTGWYVEGDAPVGDTIQYKPMQININGAWRTISG